MVIYSTILGNNQGLLIITGFRLFSALPDGRALPRAAVWAAGGGLGVREAGLWSADGRERGRRQRRERRADGDAPAGRGGAAGGRRRDRRQGADQAGRVESVK